MKNDVEGIVTPEENMAPDTTDLLEMDMKELDFGCDEHDWSCNKNQALIGALNECAENFYRNMNNTFNDDQCIILHDEDVYMPENCKGKAQKKVIFIHLYVHYQWLDYENTYL